MKNEDLREYKEALNMVSKEEYVTIKEIENGTRKIVVAKKNNRIVISQKINAFGENGKSIDIFLKNSINIGKENLKDLIFALIESL